MPKDSQAPKGKCEHCGGVLRAVGQSRVKQGQGACRLEGAAAAQEVLEGAEAEGGGVRQPGEHAVRAGVGAVHTVLSQDKVSDGE